jgi:UDP-N-acetylmuramyl pentapeptide phosphotransferase/UDP-N-acetylglucosamine-1-phosphate transferase
MPLAVWWFLMALIGTWFLSLIWKPIAKRWNIVDIVGRRRLHRDVVIRGGGVGIAIMMSLCCLMIYRLDSTSPMSMMLIIAGLLISASAVGMFDDIKKPTSTQKLILYFLLAVLMAIAFYFVYSGWLLLVLLGVLIVHLNAWNFMDGSNGLITLQALLIATAYLVTGNGNQHSVYYASALMGCCLGFLPFNFPTARMFLGDIGSHALGAAVFGLFLLATMDNSWSILDVLVLSSALWIDAVLTFMRRAILGYRVTTPHRSHLYQYFVRTRLGHTWTALCYAMWTSICIAAVYVSPYFNHNVQTVILVMMIFMGICLHQYFRLFTIRHYRAFVT